MFGLKGVPHSGQAAASKLPRRSYSHFQQIHASRIASDGGRIERSIAISIALEPRIAITPNPIQKSGKQQSVQAARAPGQIFIPVYRPRQPTTNTNGVARSQAVYSG